MIYFKILLTMSNITPNLKKNLREATRWQPQNSTLDSTRLLNRKQHKLEPISTRNLDLDRQLHGNAHELEMCVRYPFE